MLFAWVRNGLSKLKKLDYYLPKYKMYYSERPDRTGGEVMICVADHYDLTWLWIYHI